MTEKNWKTRNRSWRKHWRRLMKNWDPVKSRMNRRKNWWNLPHRIWSRTSRHWKNFNPNFPNWNWKLPPAPRKTRLLPKTCHESMRESKNWKKSMPHIQIIRRIRMSRKKRWKNRLKNSKNAWSSAKKKSKIWKKKWKKLLPKKNVWWFPEKISLNAAMRWWNKLEIWTKNVSVCSLERKNWKSSLTPASIICGQNTRSHITTQKKMRKIPALPIHVWKARFPIQKIRFVLSVMLMSMPSKITRA